jgi:hypothetical protein
MTALSPLNLFVRCAAIATLLGAGNALASDPHHGDAHAPAKKPVALTPAHPKSTHHPAAEKMPKASHGPVKVHTLPASRVAKKTAAEHPKAEAHSKAVEKSAIKTENPEKKAQSEPKTVHAAKAAHAANPHTVH